MRSNTKFYNSLTVSRIVDNGSTTPVTINIIPDLFDFNQNTNGRVVGIGWAVKTRALREGGGKVCVTISTGPALILGQIDSIIHSFICHYLKHFMAT